MAQGRFKRNRDGSGANVADFHNLVVWYNNSSKDQAESVLVGDDRAATCAVRTLADTSFWGENASGRAEKALRTSSFATIA